MSYPSHPPAHERFRRGISLVEVLSAVAVIAILGAILSPAVSQVRGNSQSAKCASNLRQIGVAFAIYRGENDGAVPKVYDSASKKYWFHFLQEAGALTDARILACPSVTSSSTMWGTTPPSRVNYGMLDASIWYPTLHRSQDEPRLWMRVAALSDWPVVMDASTMAIYKLDDPVASAPANSRFTARHNGRANVLMADGHIERVAAGDRRWHQSVLNRTQLP